MYKFNCHYITKILTTIIVEKIACKHKIIKKIKQKKYIIESLELN